MSKSLVAVLLLSLAALNAAADHGAQQIATECPEGDCAGAVEGFPATVLADVDAALQDADAAQDDAVEQTGRQLLHNGGMEGAASADNGFFVNFDGASTTSADVHGGDQAVDLGVPGGQPQNWSAYGNVVLRALPHQRFVDVHEVSYWYNVPTLPVGTLSIHHYLTIDLDGDLGTDACVMVSPRVPATGAWTRAVFDRQATYLDGHCGDGTLDLGEDGAPLAQIQASHPDARLVSIAIQTIYQRPAVTPTAPYPAGYPVYVDDASVLAAGPQGVPLANGLVAAFRFGSGSQPSAVPALELTEDGIDVEVEAWQDAGEAYAPATGPLRLVAQLDCGALSDAPGLPVACQGHFEYLADDVADPIAGTYAFHLDSAAFDAAFGEDASTGIHFFVERNGQDSHYLAGNDVLIGAGLHEVADGLEEGTFTPVVLLRPGALPTGDPRPDGFTAAIAVGGSLPTDGAAVLALLDGPTLRVTATPYVATAEGDNYEVPSSGVYVLRFYATGPDGESVTIPADRTNPAYYRHANGAPLVFDVPAEDLAPFGDTPGNGYVVQIIQLNGPNESTSAQSNLLLPKEALLAAAGDPVDADPAAILAADALDGRESFTPLFVVRQPHVGDGMVARITPQNAFRTSFGSIVELDNAVRVVLEVCAFDETGTPYPFTDFRIEFDGKPRDPASPSTVVLSAGTYNLPVGGIGLAPNDGDACHLVAVRGSALVSGSSRLDNLFTVSLWLPLEETGVTSRYSETVNALTSGDGADFAVANELDLVTSSGILVVGARMNPLGPGDASTERALSDPEGFADAALGGVQQVTGPLPNECPDEAPGEFPLCVPSGPVGQSSCGSVGVPPCPQQGAAGPQSLKALPGWLRALSGPAEQARSFLSGLFPFLG